MGVPGAKEFGLGRVGEVPLADFANKAGIAGGGEELRAVGGEGEGGDVAAVAGERAE